VTLRPAVGYGLMPDDWDKRRDRTSLREDAFSSVRLMIWVMATTYVIYRVLYYFVHTSYIDATFRDMLSFELGAVIFTVIRFIHAMMRHD
jgi:hypothetical protein